MKKRFFITTAIAMAMGFGVAVGAHAQGTAKAEAWDLTTWYYIGADTGWDWDNDYAFTENDYTGRYETPVLTLSHQTFKITLNDNWDNQINCYDLAGDKKPVNWDEWGTYVNWKSDGNFEFKSEKDGIKVILYFNASDMSSYELPGHAIHIEEVHEVTIHYNSTSKAINVKDGELPADPLNYGQTLVGWYEESGYVNKVTSVTADGDLYAKAENTPTLSFTVDFSAVSTSFEHPYYYAYQSSKKYNAAWPGTALTGSVTVPNDAKVVISNSSDGTAANVSDQTTDIVLSGFDNDVLRVLNSKTETKYNTNWASEVPAANGYYISGTFNSFKYLNAIQMETASVTHEGYNAEYLYLDVHANEEIRVRQYDGSDKWATFIADSKSAAVGAVSGDNIKFSKDTTVNVMAKWEDDSGWKLRFYVEESEQTCTVTPVIDGVAGTPVTNHVVGTAFAQPAPVFGKTFDGWYSDSGYNTPITTITETCSVYGRTSNIPTVTYHVYEELVASDYEDLYLYAFEENGAINATFPGVEIADGDLTVPNDATLVISDGTTTHQTVNITQSGVSNDVILIAPELSDGKNIYTWASNVDVPAIGSGYYVCPNDDYTGASKMILTGEVDENVNLAYYIGYEANADDEIRVSSFWPDRWPFNEEAKPGDSEVGTIVSGNKLKISADGTYDIYVKRSPSDHKLYFYVATHVAHTVEIIAVKFAGADKVGTIELPDQLSYPAEFFVPNKPAVLGYVARDVYTDAACTVPYTETKFEADTHLYIKYTKVGYYVTYGPSYSIDDATLMETAGIGANNKAEVMLNVVAANSCYSFVYYDSNGTMSGHAGLGDSHTYVEYDTDPANIKFITPGVYQIYWNKNDNKLYSNDGLMAFYTGFLSATGNICNGYDGVTNNGDAIAAIWEAQRDAFNALGGAKSTIIALDWTEGNEDGSEQEQFVARYHYLVTKYGTAKLEDFIWGNEDIPPRTVGYIPGIFNMKDSDNSTMLIVIAVAAISTLSIAALLVIRKKRKENN